MLDPTPDSDLSVQSSQSVDDDSSIDLGELVADAIDLVSSFLDD